MFFNIFGKFEFIAEVFALINDLVSKEISQFDDIINVVTIFNVVRFVNHSDVIKNVVFSCDKLK